MRRDILIRGNDLEQGLDTADKMTGKVQKAFSSVNDEVVKAALQMVTLIQGARTIRDAFKKSQGDRWFGVGFLEGTVPGLKIGILNQTGQHGC